MELNCKFSTNISESLRGQIVSERLCAKESMDAFHLDLRGVAVLELGFVDIELNVETSGWEKYGDECKPSLDYFICAKSADNGITDGWDSYDYAETCLPDEDAHANIDWAAENWEELLFRDMLDSLLKFINSNKMDGLLFLSPNCW